MKAQKNNSSKVGLIYKITNLVNHKIYVGQTRSTLLQRWNQHLKCVSKNVSTTLYHAMRLHGIENFKIEPIKFYKNSLLNKQESFWIKELNSRLPPKGDGYNMNSGGRVKPKGRKGKNHHYYGKTRSEDVKRKISESRKGQCTGIDNPFFGKKHSIETIEKIKISREKTIKENGGWKLRGENHPGAKLSLEKIQEMKEIHQNEKLSYSKIAELFQVSTMTAWNAINDKFYK